MVEGVVVEGVVVDGMVEGVVVDGVVEGVVVEGVVLVPAELNQENNASALASTLKNHIPLKQMHNKIVHSNPDRLKVIQKLMSFKPKKMVAQI